MCARFLSHFLKTNFVRKLACSTLEAIFCNQLPRVRTIITPVFKLYRPRKIIVTIRWYAAAGSKIDEEDGDGYIK